MTSKTRRPASWLAGLCVALAAPTAGAEVAIEIGKVKGPGWSRIRAAVLSTVSARPELEVVRTNGDGRIDGVVRRAGRGQVATLTVVDAAGVARGSARFSGVNAAAVAADVKERLWAELGSVFSSLEPKSRPAPAAEAAKGPAQEDKPAPAPKPAPPPAATRRADPRRVEPRPAAAPTAQATASPPRAEAGGSARTLAQEAMRFRFGLGWFARDFSWVDDLFSSLASYQLAGAPSFALGAQWFPGAHANSGPLGWVGLEVDAELPFALTSERLDDSFPTAASAWRVGLIGRIPVGPVEVAAGVGLDERRFAIEPSAAGAVVSDFPEVRYTTLSTRLAVTVRALDVLDLSVRGGWGFMLDAGAIGRELWFPRSQSHTASAGAMVRVELGSGVGVYGQFDWTGAFFDLAPEPGDARVAGGAADHYYLGSAGLSYAL